MKENTQRILKLTAVAFMMALFVTGCNDDDNKVEPSLTGQSKTYTLNSVSNPAISGTVKFAERNDNSTVVTIDLDGTTAGTHPAHIHENTAAETGGIIIDLNSVNGSDGISETIVSKLNNGTAIKYSELLMLNGYVNVHASATDLATLIAQGDIGQNELTASSTTYALTAVNDSGVNGTVTFAKRVSGATLVTVALTGASPTANYPIYIYDNDVATTGPVAINLNNYLGSTGKSVTSVRKLINNTAITYDGLTDFNGHVNVGTSATDPAYVAQGNIGSN
jgi:Cu/Zn superoxide dismutase